MFSTLRQGASIYILDKGNKNKEPKLSIGQVESVTAPQPRVSVGYPYSINNSNDTVIDIKVKVNDDILDFQKMPTNLSFATIGNVVISDNREDAINAVDNFYQNSKRILEDVSYHEQVVKACDEMMTMLNPAYAKDKERDTAIESLQKQVACVQDEFRGALSEIKNILSMYAPSCQSASKQQ